MKVSDWINSESRPVKRFCEVLFVKLKWKKTVNWAECEYRQCF